MSGRGIVEPDSKREEANKDELPGELALWMSGVGECGTQ